MTTVTVKASQTYEVKIGRGLLETVGQETAALLKGRQAAIVSDTNVAPLYLDRVQASLEGAGFQVCSFVFPAGEDHKKRGNLPEPAGVFGPAPHHPGPTPWWPWAAAWWEI